MLTLLFTACSAEPLAPQKTLPQINYCAAYANALDVEIELKNNIKYYHFNNITITEEELFNNCLTKEVS